MLPKTHLYLVMLQCRLLPSSTYCYPSPTNNFLLFTLWEFSRIAKHWCKNASRNCALYFQVLCAVCFVLVLQSYSIVSRGHLETKGLVGCWVPGIHPKCCWGIGRGIDLRTRHDSMFPSINIPILRTSPSAHWTYPHVVKYCLHSFSIPTLCVINYGMFKMLRL